MVSRQRTASDSRNPACLRRPAFLFRQESGERTGQGGGRFRISPPSLDLPLIQTAKKECPFGYPRKDKNDLCLAQLCSNNHNYRLADSFTLKYKQVSFSSGETDLFFRSRVYNWTGKGTRERGLFTSSSASLRARQNDKGEAFGNGALRQRHGPCQPMAQTFSQTEWIYFVKTRFFPFCVSTSRLPLIEKAIESIRALPSVIKTKEIAVPSLTIEYVPDCFVSPPPYFFTLSLYSTTHVPSL